jgi:hypothetical protein
MEPRTRAVVAFSVLGAVLVALAAVVIVAGVWVVRDERDEDAGPVMQEAVVVEDLCAVVKPAVPSRFGLDDGQPSNDSADGEESASCVFASSDETRLEVSVTSYDLLEGDPDGELDQMVGTTCDAVEQQYAPDFTEDEFGCGGQTSDKATGPEPATATRISTLPHRNAVVTVVLTDRDAPAAVGAYAAGITFGVVSGDLTG